MTAKSELTRQITGCMRLSNIGVTKAKRLNMRVMSFSKRVNDVGAKIIGGGTRTKNAGIQSGIGTTTTTEITATRMTTVDSRLKGNAALRSKLGLQHERIN